MKKLKTLLLLCLAFVSLQSLAQKNEEKKDSCDFNKFTIEDENITINDNKLGMGMFVTLNLNDKKGAASKVLMLLEIENCKGEKQTVKLELFFNEKTGLWSGKQVIPQNPDCPWKVSSFKYIIYNACNDEYESEWSHIESVKSGRKLPARDRIIERRRRG